MQLNKVEKLLLLMLCDIGKRQKIKSDFDYEFIEKAIYTGNTWAVESRYSNVFNTEEVDADVVTFTGNILKMWEDLERAYDNLSPEDKNCVKIEAEPFGNNVKFSGFCGNTECDYIGVAEFLVNKMNRFQKFVGVELNSHAPMVEIYSRMYSAYRPLKEKMISGMDVLSRESLIAILKEQIHPEHR